MAVTGKGYHIRRVALGLTAHNRRLRRLAEGHQSCQVMLSGAHEALRRRTALLRSGRLREAVWMRPQRLSLISRTNFVAAVISEDEELDG